MFDTLTDWTGYAPPTVAAIAAAVAFASFVRGMTGFGSAIILAPVLSLLMTPERAVLLNILTGALIGPFGYPQARKLTHARQTIPFTVGAVAAAPLGLYLLAQTPPHLARIAIASIAILAFFLVLARRPALPPEGIGPAVGFGAGTGLIGGFAGIPGPTAVYYFVRDGVPANVSRASLLVVFFWGILGMALAAVAAGKVELKLAILALIMLPSLVVGNALGERFFGKADPRLWRGVIMALLALAIAVACWRAAIGA